MGTMTKIAVAIGLSAFAGSALAAAPADMQNRTDTRAQQILTKLNTTTQEMSCREMSDQLAQAGKSGSKLKGVVLKNALTEAITTTSEKNNLKECISTVMASNAAAKASGVSTGAKGGLLGKAPGAAGLLGGAGVAAAGTSTLATVALGLAGAAAVATVVNELDDDDDPVSGTTQ